MKAFLVIAFISITVYLSFTWSVVAYDCIDTHQGMSVEEYQGIERACQDILNSTKNQISTLKQAIASVNAKINLAQAQINQTISQISSLEKDITVLSGVLDTVKQSMSELTKIYLARVKESYRRSRVTSIDLIFSSGSMGDYLTKFKYLNSLKAKDQLILTELENSRKDYDLRKQTKVTKQQEIEKLKAKMEAQKKTLSSQQQEKQSLLVMTQNDEKKYQSLLAKVRAELEAIESIIAGKGSESLVRDVSANEKIANVISGSSACSTGGHLHFEVVKDGSHQSPAGFLKPKDNLLWDNSPDGPISLTGSWEWPLDDQIRITQGYGHTAFSRRYVGDVLVRVSSIGDQSPVAVVPSNMFMSNTQTIPTTPSTSTSTISEQNN
ncbi:MAG: Peptidase M23 [Candidatus Collierbacteria bacterium GW2011_GWB1_44_197]|nr:MAG: Peptidase M23 [Candidatus Collierbacteria bacterium GW2011_GWB1_44_197]